MPTNPIILSFSGGLLTPYMATRVDQEKYYSGCRKMSNMIALPYGPAMRTPGTEFIATEKTQSKKVKLFPFKYSVDQSYIIEAGHQYMRFYKGGTSGYGQIMYKTLTLDDAPVPAEWSADATLTGTTSGETCVVVAKVSSTVYTIKHLTGDFTDGEVISDGVNARDCGAGYPVVTTSETPAEITTVYTEDDLFDLHVVGMNDVMDIVHTQHTIKPYRLSRLDHDDWTITAKDFTYGPFLEENKTDTTLYCNAVTGTGKTLTASAALFDYPTNDHIGSIWQLVQKTAESRIKGDLDAVEESDPIRCSGGWTFVTEGDWIGDVELQRSYDGGTTWYPYRQFTRQLATANNYYIPDGTEDEEDVYYRVAMTARTSGTCKYCFAVNDNTVKGIVKITAIASTTSATVDILIDLGNSGAGSATKKWNEGAWSDKRGYPGTIGLFQQRSIFGGNTYRPQFVWTSRTGDYENMRLGILDTHALAYELASGNQDFIKWLIGFSEILIGTKGAEYKLGPPIKGQALTWQNPNAPIQSTYGGSDIQPIVGNDVVLYWGRQRRKLWEIIYSYDAEAYVSRDLALYAENITEGGIVDMAYQQQPFPIVWAVRADGKPIAMTYMRTHKIEGWHEHPTDGEVESVAVIPSSGEDEVWFSVKRTINSLTKRYIERMKPHDWGTDQKDCFFVHSGLTFDGGAAVDITDISVGADPYKVTVTATAHGFSDGYQVRFEDIVAVAAGAGETDLADFLNHKIFTVSDKTDNAFILKDKDNEIYITGENFTAYTSGGTVQRVENVMTDLGHLEAKEVAILADGIPLPNKTVSATGSITLDEYANIVHVGLPYDSELMPMDVEIPLRSGTSKGRTKRVIDATIYFHESSGCEFGTDVKTDQISFMKTTDTMGQPTPLHTGDKKVSFSGGYDTFTNLYIKQSLPLPLTVVSIIPTIDIAEW